MLGPILFIIYVNDLPGVVESLTMLLVDDIKLYRIVNIEDHDKLHGDIVSGDGQPTGSSASMHQSVKLCTTAAETRDSHTV